MCADFAANAGLYVPGIPTVNGGPVGELVRVQLSDGQPTSLDDPSNEAGIAHVSTRNLDRPGWAYVSYYHGTQGQGGTLFRDEIVAVKMDGSGVVEPLAYEHSDPTASYYAYPMAVPSPDGTRVVFASNWAYDGNGNPTDYQDYVVDTRAPTTVWHQASPADFNAGVFAGTAVATAAGGIRLAPTGIDDFSGSTLSPAWQTTSWGAGSTLTLSGGILALADREVYSAQATSGAALGRLAFSDARDQYFGLATDLGALAGNYWAVFSTHGTTNWLYALVNTDGKLRDYKLGALPAGFHVYQVQPVSGGFQFTIDGVLRMTIAANFPAGTALKVALSTSDLSPQPPLQADWVQVDSYLPTGTFTSTVFDVAWGTATSETATWTASLPAGTTLTVQTRAGDTAAPDATWSAWAAVANGRPVSSPKDCYLQYRVILTTTDPAQTPVLWSIDFAWS